MEQQETCFHSKESPCWIGGSKTILLHYQSASNHIEEQITKALQAGRCQVYRYQEDFYEKEAVTAKQVLNCECLFGTQQSSKADNNQWVIKTKVLEQIPGNGVLLTQETRPNYTPSSEISVRFNVLGFEIPHNDHHTTTYDIVFLNGWHKQYYTVCCEKFSWNTPQSYKLQFYQTLQAEKVAATVCYPKFRLHKEHFENKNFTQKACKFQPTFHLVNCLIESHMRQSQVSNLSLKQIECLIVLCQQIQLKTKNDFDMVHEQVESLSVKYRADLFSAMIGDTWNVKHTSVQVFKIWALFPYQHITQPQITYKVEVISESPYFFRYLISSKYGNIQASNCLVQLFLLEDDELQQLAKSCGVPQKRNIETQNRFPFKLLQRNRKGNHVDCDPRLWYFNPSQPKTFTPSDFDCFIFGLDWYLLCLYVLGMRFEDHAELVGPKIKEHNLGLYYHFLRQSTGNLLERVEYSKLAISHGINEDVNLILATATNGEKYLWEELANLFNL